VQLFGTQIEDGTMDTQVSRMQHAAGSPFGNDGRDGEKGEHKVAIGR